MSVSEWHVIYYLTVCIGYGRLGGSKASAEELLEILHSMEENGLLHPTRLLTGEFISAVECLMIAYNLQATSRVLRVCLLSLLSPESLRSRIPILSTLWTVRTNNFLVDRDSENRFFTPQRSLAMVASSMLLQTLCLSIGPCYHSRPSSPQIILRLSKLIQLISCRYETPDISLEL